MLPIKSFKVLDTFSGIGGFSLGLEAAGGYETVAFVEIHPPAQFFLRKHWPNTPIYSDIRELNGHELIQRHGRIDLACGGFPCQDISVAGKQAGLGTKEDPTRSGLFYALARLIDEIRPRWILLENVAALKTKGYDLVHDELERIDYTCWPTVVAASDVGAPHKRERTWIVGFNKRELGNAELYGLLTAEISRSIGETIRHYTEGAHEAGESAGAGSSRELADADRTREHGAEGSGQVGGWPQDRGDEGRGSVADAAGAGLEDGIEARGLTAGTQGRSELVAQSERRSASAEELADAASLGMEGLRPSRVEVAEVHVGEGLPVRDGGRGRAWHWPARPGQPQHEWEAPRLTPVAPPEPRLDGAVDGLPKELSTPGKLRKQQLMAYGNTIVPQIAELWGGVIRDLDAIITAHTEEVEV